MWVGPGRASEEGLGVGSRLSVPNRRLPGSGHPGRARGPVRMCPQCHTVLRPLQRAFRDIIPSGLHTQLYSAINNNGDHGLSNYSSCTL